MLWSPVLFLGVVSTFLFLTMVCGSRGRRMQRHRAMLEECARQLPAAEVSGRAALVQLNFYHGDMLCKVSYRLGKGLGLAEFVFAADCPGGRQLIVQSREGLLSGAGVFNSMVRRLHSVHFSEEFSAAFLTLSNDADWAKLLLACGLADILEVLPPERASLVWKNGTCSFRTLHPPGSVGEYQAFIAQGRQIAEFADTMEPVNDTRRD